LNRVRFALQAVVLAQALWAGVLASYIATPLAVLVLPAFLLTVVGIARPETVASRGWLQRYVTMSVVLGLAPVVWLLAHALYVNHD
jgi:hypothetical protein